MLIYFMLYVFCDWIVFCKAQFVLFFFAKLSVKVLYKYFYLFIHLHIYKKKKKNVKALTTVETKRLLARSKIKHILKNLYLFKLLFLFSSRKMSRTIEPMSIFLLNIISFVLFYI